MGVGINQGKQLVILSLALWFSTATPTAFSQNTSSSAEYHDTQLVDSVTTVDQLQEGDQLFWPMLPGDTIEQLATKFYPNSPILKQRFMLKTLSLSRALNLSIQINEPFKSPHFVIIPNDKAVRELTHRIKKAEEIKQNQDALKLSYMLIHTPPSVTDITPVSKQSQIALPKVQIPEVEIPNIQSATVDLSQVKTKVSAYWGSITQKSLLMTKHLNQESLGLINSYRSKNFNQILNDYRLRNIALITIILMGAIVLWLLNKKYQRQQAAMLSLIGSESLISEAITDSEALQSSSLVEQIESLIAQKKVSVPDVEDFEIAEQLANIEIEEVGFSRESNQDTADINDADKPAQVHEQNGYH
ncbi:MAG: hypothetical protein ACO1N8_04685 [Methylophilus sp.]